MQKRMISPECPKCKNRNTHDLSLKFLHEHKDPITERQQIVIGNAAYYCRDCGCAWKKYRGRDPYQRIKVMNVEAGGYPGLYYRVRIKRNTLKVAYNNIMDFDDTDMDEGKSISKMEMEWFLSELHACDMLNWAEEYHDLDVLDGTQWRIRIEYDTYCEVKIGNNHFPEGWKRFCNAISMLTGKEFY